MASVFYLDTNIIYYLTETSGNTKLDSTIFHEKKLAITTSTLLEIIARNKNNRTLLAQYFNYIKINKIEICDFHNVCLSKRRLRKLEYSTNLNRILKLCDKYTHKKITLEKEYITFMFTIIAIGSMETIGEQYINYMNTQHQQNHAILTRQFMEANLHYCSEEFRKALVKIYYKSLPANAIKDFFTNTLLSYLVAFEKLSHVALHTNNLDDKNRKIPILDHNNNLLNKLAAQKENPISLIAKKSNHNQFSSYLKDIKAELSSLTRLSEIELKYLTIYFRKVFYDKMKPSKNDMFDFLGIAPLRKSKTIIVTCDGLSKLIFGELDPQKNLHLIPTLLSN